MYRFDDLDQHLRREEASRQDREAELQRKLQEARDRYDPYLRRAYTVFGDYYSTILAPKGYRLFPRKKETLTPNEQLHIDSRTILYAYVANILSPQSERPYPYDDDPFHTWSYPEIGELDYHVWHPNIGLHFATIITPKDRTIEETKLSIGMQAWGRIGVDKSALALQGISVSSGDGGWKHIATYVGIEPKETHLEDQVETGLKLLTPNVIHHKEAFNKQYS